MRSGATTRGQLLTHYERLKKRVENMRLSDALQTDLVAVAKAVLGIYPILSSSSTSSRMPDAEELEERIQNLLTSPVDIFNDRFFRAPLFPVVTFHNAAAFYGWVCPQEPIFDMLNLSDDDKSNNNGAIHAWFTESMGCDRETNLAAVDRFRNHSRFPQLHPPSVRPCMFESSSNRAGRFVWKHHYT